MFTGIIREMGRIASRAEIPGGIRFQIDAPGIATESDISEGDSVAVDGCCLTVVADRKAGGSRPLSSGPCRRGRLAFDLSPETLDRTIARTYVKGSRVNLEPSLRVGDKIGGHFVTGHVDTVGKVLKLKRDGEFAVLAIALDESSKGFVAEKGSISVNGVSLTVSAWKPARQPRTSSVFEVALIPATMEHTNMGSLSIGAMVNIEYDLIARYLRELYPMDIAAKRHKKHKKE